MKLLLTADGSLTIQLEGKDTTYHSRHGAIQESMHVFINSGLQHILHLQPKTDLAIFEMGFGTGLNAFLTFIELENRQLQISYDSIDVQPLPPTMYAALHYAEQLGLPEADKLFIRLHTFPWNESFNLSAHFRFTKMLCDIHNFNPVKKYDLIYYDAFSPRDVPDQWTPNVFSKLYSLMNEQGVLVTYCSKSIVRRSMQAAGFEVCKLPGPPGKREIVRALKK